MEHSIIRAVKKVDVSERLALHEQVAAEIRRAIADDEAKPGERLPPARDLAAVLGVVNTNTVFRALRILREEGLLEFRRGRGGSPSRAPLSVGRCSRRHASSSSLHGTWGTVPRKWRRSSGISRSRPLEPYRESPIASPGAPCQCPETPGVDHLRTGSIRSIVSTRSSERSNDATRWTPVLSAHAAR